jgi:hypothetical protein
MKETIRACVNSILTGEAPPPRSWIGGLICFLLKKEDVLHTAGYRPVYLLDTVYKILSAIVTDRLYRLAERHGLLDPSQEGFRRLHSTQRQVQSLHWVIQDAAAWQSEGRQSSESAATWTLRMRSTQRTTRPCGSGCGS